MHVLVLPVSGGGFVTQLAILQHLCEAKFVPDLTLASSGGNVAAYVAAAANWKWAGIERVARELSQSFFTRPWSSITPLSFLIGYFKGDIWNLGDGVSGFLHRHFDPESITTHEIWTGTYNRTRQRSRLICNRAASDSILDTTTINYELTQSMPPLFADGDIELLARGGLASASIPGFVPPQIIENEKYIDGGVGAASPLTIMQEPLLRWSKAHDRPLHLIYVNSNDLSCPQKKPTNNILDAWRQAAANLIRSQNVVDRLAAYNILRTQPGDIVSEEFPCTFENMQRVCAITAKVRYSLLEIFPTSNFDIDLDDFDGEVIIAAIRRAYGKCRCRLWWLQVGAADDEISSLLSACKGVVVADELSQHSRSSHDSVSPVSIEVEATHRP